MTTFFIRVVTLIFFSTSSFATIHCRNVHASRIPGISEKPMEQMMLWEQKANTKSWEKPTLLSDIEVSLVDPRSVTIRSTKDPGSIIKMVQGMSAIRWPKHPWNKDSNVPHFTDPIANTWKARFSASRSMFFYTSSKDLYSIKMPTDYPHKGYSQPTKSDLKNSVVISHRRSEMIEKIQEAQLSEDPHFDILLDVLTIADVQTGNGFVVRDLRKLQDGKYYLPAFSVPYAGKEIAKHLGVDFETLWGASWGELLGVSKAKLLLRFGLQMKTPNAQNMLIQLDTNLKPTGKMLFRDISDSSLVLPVAEGLGLSKNIQMDQDNNFSVYRALEPNWSNSSWQMDEGGVSHQILTKWGSRHDIAYVQTIVAELRKTQTGEKLFANGSNALRIYALQELLFSSSGKQALQEYRRMTTRSMVNGTQSVYDP